MPMIILKNRSRQRFLFSLYHEEVCRRTGKCTCQTVLEAGPNGGRVSKRYPASVQIDAGSQSAPLPAAVFGVPQVRNAVLKTQKLVRVELTDAESAALSLEAAKVLQEQHLCALNARRVSLGLARLSAVDTTGTVADETAKAPARAPQESILTKKDKAKTSTSKREE